MDICNIIHSVKAGAYENPLFEDPLGAIVTQPHSTTPKEKCSASFTEITQQIDFQSTTIRTISISSEIFDVESTETADILAMNTTPPTSPLSQELKAEVKKSHIFEPRVIAEDPLDRQRILPLARSFQTPIEDDAESISRIREFIRPIQNSSSQFFDTGQVHGIGLSNALFLPSSWIAYIQFLYKAIKTGDTEGIIEYGLKVFAGPFGITQAFETGFSMAYVALKGINITIFLLSSIIFGSIFLTIELGLEIARLVRTIQFRNTIQPTVALSLVKNLNLSKIQTKKDLEVFLESLKSIKTSLCYFMSDSEAAKRIDSITCILSNDQKEFSEKIHLASECLEDLKLRLLTSALSSIHETYLFLSEQEIYQCDTRALKESKFGRDNSDFTENGEALTKSGLQKFNQYIHLFSVERSLLLEGKRSSLGRRVRLKMVNTLESTLPLIFSMYRDYEENKQSTKKNIRLDNRSFIIESSTSLLEKLDVQSRKTLLVHTVGTIAILIGIAGFAAGLVACPPVTLLVLVIVGFVLSLYRDLAPGAYLDSDGYTWNMNAILPNFLKKQTKQDLRQNLSPTELQHLVFDREQEKHTKTIGTSFVLRKNH